MKNFTILSVFSSLLLAIAITPAGADVLNVWILTGQSNSLGTTGQDGASWEYTSTAGTTNAKFYYTDISPTTTAYPAAPADMTTSGAMLTGMETQVIAGTNYWGPEMGLVSELYTQGYTDNYVIKASRGGGGNTLWMGTGGPDAANGQMYNYLTETARDGIQAALDGGHSVDISGLIYLQGESNTTTDAAAAATRLGTMTTNMLDYLDTEFATEIAAGTVVTANTKLLVTQIADIDDSAARVTTVNNKVQWASTTNKATYIDTSYLPLGADDLHFAKDSKEAIGASIATTYINLTTQTTAQQVAAQSANTRAHYTMNETTGATSLVDSSPNAQNVNTGSITSVAGVVGTGVKTGAAAVVANADSPDFGTETFSVNFWFNKQTDSTYHFLSNKGATSFSGSAGWAIWVESNTKLGIQTNDAVDASQRVYSAAGSVTNDTWNMATLVIDREAQMMYAYLNGVQFSAIVITNPNFTTTADWNVVHAHGANDYYDEYLATATGLTQTNVNNLYYGAKYAANGADKTYVFSDHFDQYAATGTGLYAFGNFGDNWVATDSTGNVVDANGESSIYTSSRSKNGAGTNTDTWISNVEGTRLTSIAIAGDNFRNYELDLMALVPASGGANSVNVLIEIFQGDTEVSSLIFSDTIVALEADLTVDDAAAWHTLNFATGASSDDLFLRITLNEFQGATTYLLVDNVMLSAGAEVPEPATLCLLAFGGMAILKRRKR